MVDTRADLTTRRDWYSNCTPTLVAIPRAKGGVVRGVSSYALGRLDLAVQSLPLHGACERLRDHGRRSKRMAAFVKRIRTSWLKVGAALECSALLAVLVTRLASVCRASLR